MLSNLVLHMVLLYHPCETRCADILNYMNTIPYRRFITGAMFLSLLGLLLFIIGAITNQQLTHAYLFWNLFLAWIPFGLSLIIYISAAKQWSILVSILLAIWLLFLPNTFYMLTGYIHVTEVARVDPVFDSVMFGVIIPIGFALGIASLLLVHTTLLRFVSVVKSHVMIGIIIAASSFAIYLGRVLRFNSWDIIANPIGLLSDIINIVFQPYQNGMAYSTTFTFFIVITAIYMAAWYMMNEPRMKKD